MALIALRDGEGRVVMRHYCAVCAEERREESHDGTETCRHKVLLEELQENERRAEDRLDELREGMTPIYGY